MRLLLTTLVLILFYNISSAQQWQLQYTVPDVELNNINFLNANTGYVFGDSSLNGTFIKGVVMRTDDHGTTWNELDFGSADYRVYDSYLLNGSHIYAAGRNAAGGGNSGLFVMSADGGSTWINPSIFPERLFSVGFISLNTGWVGGKNGHFSKTTDGGTSWSANINLTNEDILDIKFYNSTTGIVACGGGELFRTTDGGQTWNLVSIPTTEDLNSISVVNNNTWICGGGGTIIYSSDLGATWINQTSGTTIDLNCIGFYDTNSGFAAGPAGSMIITNNGGNMYATMASNCIDDIVSMSVINASSAWYCSPEGDIYTLNNPTGISLQESSITVELFPNPSHNHLFFSGSHNIQLVQILNIHGAIVKQLEYSNNESNQIEITALEAGTYFIRFISGSKAVTKMFVKN